MRRIGNVEREGKGLAVEGEVLRAAHALPRDESIDGIADQEFLKSGLRRKDPLRNPPPRGASGRRGSVTRASKIPYREVWAHFLVVEHGKQERHLVAANRRGLLEMTKKS